MGFVIQVATSFIAISCFAVLFNAPVKLLPYCGVVGAVGWSVNNYLNQYGVDAVQGSFIGAFIVAIIAHLFARKFKVPVLVFSVSGIISLVPGSTAYNAMRNMIEFNYIVGVEYAIRAMMISGALAMGLIFAEVFMMLLLQSKQKGLTSMDSFAKLKRPRKEK